MFQGLGCVVHSSQSSLRITVVINCEFLYMSVITVVLQQTLQEDVPRTCDWCLDGKDGIRHKLPGGGGALGIHAASFGRSEALKAQRLMEVTLSSDEKIGSYVGLPSLATWKSHRQVDKCQAVSEDTSDTSLSHTVHVTCVWWFSGWVIWAPRVAQTCLLSIGFSIIVSSSPLIKVNQWDTRHGDIVT